MKKLLETILLVAAFSLVAGNGWALSIAVGDEVIMTAPSDGEHYLMADTTTGAIFNTFCLEKYDYFYSGVTYKVDSMGMDAVGGGINDENPNTGVDPVSEAAVWLYASYFDGVFGLYTAELVDKVQNAIWFAEDETRDYGDFKYRKF